jgi:hypothetical protein
MLESVAISEYQKYESLRKKAKQPCLTFMEWLREESIKLADISDAQQFWIREIIRTIKR